MIGGGLKSIWYTIKASYDVGFINMFKSFSSYEDFISNFPTIDIQVDRMTEYSILKAYYDNFYDEIYDLVQNTYNLSNCIFNTGRSSRCAAFVSL